MHLFNKLPIQITLLNYSMKFWNTLFIIFSLYLTLPGLEQIIQLIRAGSNTINLYALLNFLIIIAVIFAGLLRFLDVRKQQFPNFITCLLMMLYILPVTALGFFGHNTQYLFFLFIYLTIGLLLRFLRSIVIK